MAGRDLRAAAVLAAVLVAIPVVPSVAADILVSADAAPSPTQVTLSSDAGEQVDAAVPSGWTVRESGDTASLTDGPRVVHLAVYDRGGRAPEAVAERLIRRDRLSGLSAALDGGRDMAADGLAGPTCVVTSTDDTSGRCAVLADDDVVVFVQSLGPAAHPALALGEVLAGLSRTEAA